MRQALLVLLLIGSPAWGQDKPTVILPEIVSPAPAPSPASPIKLGADQLYVVRSSSNCLVIASPEGVVKVTAETGPIKVKAKFVDSGDGYPVRGFPEKNIWFVEAASTGTCELLIVVEGGKEVIRRTIDSNIGPRPPPVPPDPPKPPPPDPKPDPKPIAAEKLAIVIVWESTQSTLAIARVMKDLDFWRSMEALGHKWYQLDKDQKDGKANKIIEANGYSSYIDTVGLPTIIVMDQATSKVVYSARLPDSKEAVRKIVKDITGK